VAGHLFQISWRCFWDLVLQEAVDEVKKLDCKLFMGSDLPGHLERIADSYSLEIARIDEAGIKARRRDAEHMHRHEQCSSKPGLIEVTIPFTGEAESLRIAPSVCTIPRRSAEIGIRTLTLVVREGKNAPREIAECINQIRQNLEHLRSDYCDGKEQLIRSLAQVAENRQKRIEEEEWGRVAGRLRRLM